MKHIKENVRVRLLIVRAWLIRRLAGRNMTVALNVRSVVVPYGKYTIVSLYEHE